MTIEKLIQLSLQYLEVDSELNTTEIRIDELKENDTFSEYINNIETSIYMGISRYASSLVLPIQELELKQKVTMLNFTNAYVKNAETHLPRDLNTKEKIFTRIKEVYALDEEFNVIHNLPYTLIGTKLILKHYEPNYKYYVVYYPNVMYLDNYRDKDQDVYDIDLSYLKIVDEILGEVYVVIPDEMAINLKYMIYSEIKMEDNPSIANINKNYFETYLNECKNDAQSQHYQEEIVGIDYGDRYGEEGKEEATSEVVGIRNSNYLFGGDD